MITTGITTKEEAICHLFLHCCYKDGDFKEKELDFVSGLFVALDLHATLNFKEQVVQYRNYKNLITDEHEYLTALVKQINPVHAYALYSYCAEIVLSDARLELLEEKLLQTLGGILDISTDMQQSFTALITQRKAVELEKIF
ncbi:hypothetical protein I5907_07635 [Panacibacter sp. DH6]|uniref:Co-chaperone DjlA N-terminal domain-containing protein n=1 Tax=Panacibacter microcysteis TaxID=2793269 RepID=A0A931E6D6_9BACT|nr:TerB family tellurite resistance protein [Panacibacter microcysteis]MBG9376100.1 hypothetical protein [Panacibacter microcysteis]